MYKLEAPRIFNFKNSNIGLYLVEHQKLNNLKSQMYKKNSSQAKCTMFKLNSRKTNLIIDEM